MQSEQEFYRCLDSDASSCALREIQKILADETLSDESCFQKIEAIVSLLESLGISCGGRHDFGSKKSALRRSFPISLIP